MEFLARVISPQLRAALLTLALFLLAHEMPAAEVTVRASLSRAQTTLGEPVQYQIKITGAGDIGEPPTLAVGGLGIRYIGPSQTSVMRFRNGSFSAERTTVLVYQVVPERNGSFTIPAAAITADSRLYRTEPVGLTVQPNPGSGAPNGSGGTPGEPQAIGFAEFIVPKKTAYLGEAIPVELRLYVDARVRWQPVAMPEIAGEGFTKQKLPEPQREQVQKNGREYDVLTFKTTVTPSRAGKITLGPSEIPYTARIPRARKSSPRSLFDMFDDDVFGDPFFSSVQQMKAKAEVVEITVKPLPAAGKPRDFSGAIGNFEMAVEGTPNRVKIGDPLAMKLRVSGRGNFDRMSAPVLKDAAGWRTYPPSSAFKASDEIGYTGAKTFEMAVVPETKHALMPAFEFSYFDPVAEKYVTLNSEPGPLVVEGGVAPAPAPSPATPQAVASDPPPPAPPVAKPGDILGLRYDRDAVRSFAPAHLTREFWIVQGALALALFGFLAAKLRRPPDADATARAAWRREKTAALARLRNADLKQSEFYETAAQVAQWETALSTGRTAASIDAATVRAARPLSATAAAAIDDIFAAQAELLYSGAARAQEPVSAAERERVLAALQELQQSHGRR